MIRRSLLLLLALVILAVAFTAGYSLLPVRKPEDLLADARTLIGRGQAIEAVKLLDHAEATPVIARTADLRREVWRLRLQAHRALDVSARALTDIENLIADGDASLGLQMDRIYYLAKLGLGEDARTAGLEFVKANPTIGRGRELTGEACKVAYSAQLREAAARLRSEIGFEDEREAVAAMLEMLYRPEGDPSVAAAKDRLAKLYSRESRLAQAWPTLHDQLAVLRSRIQEAGQLFESALEIAGKDEKQRTGLFAAAFQGVAYSLQQAGRIDDLEAQCEIYLGMFSHRWRTDAAVVAAAARYRDGLYESAVEIAERVAPMKTFAADLAAQKFTPGIRSLLLTRILSLYQLKSADDLVAVAATLGPLTEKYRQLMALPNLAWGLVFTLRDVRDNRTGALSWYSDLLMLEPAPQDDEDPLDLLMPLRLKSAAADGQPPADQLAAVDKWIAARPSNPMPMATRARMQLEFGQDAAAMATASGILQERPTDEDALRTLADAADRAYKASQQDGVSLLMQCLQRNTDRPDSPPNPVCYLLCGEAAMKQQHAWIALTCARLAADRFPWSVWPFLLEAKAQRMSGRHDEAIETLDRILARHPDCVDAVQMAFEIRVEHDRPTRKVLSLAIPSIPESLQVLTEALRCAVEDGSPSAAPLAQRAALAPNADANTLGLVAVAYAKQRSAAEGWAALDKALAAPRANDPASADSLLSATLACIEAEMSLRKDEELAQIAAKRMTSLRFSGPEAGEKITRTARTLADAELPATASRLLASALAMDDAIEVRSGATHELAGRLALQLGRVAAARESLTAAVSFEDGTSSAERLARIEWIHGTPGRAIAALAAAPKLTDPALALLLGSTEAARLTKERIAADPEDLLAAFAFALVSAPNTDRMAIEVRQCSLDAQRSALLACTQLEDELLEKTAVEAASAAHSQMPRSLLAALVHARALHRTGDGQGAANVHAALYEEGRRASLLWTEVARASLRGGYEPPRAILAELREMVVKQPGALRPEVLAMLACRAAADADRLGQSDVALGIYADAWRFQPKLTGATVADAEKLRAAGRSVAAVELLHKLRIDAKDNERDAAAKALYRTALEATASMQPASVAALRTLAAADLIAGTAPGEAFAFLLADPIAFASIPAEPALVLANAAMQAACTGKAAWPQAESAVLAVRQRLGAAGALEFVERSLAQFPSIPALWIRRADLRIELGHANNGIADARRMLLLAQDVDATIEFLTLAASTRRSTKADRDLFLALPPQAQMTPAGMLAAGLLALRAGRPEDAERLLAAASTLGPRAIYARALANLMRGTPEARAQARSMFESLRSDYPSNSLARNAGSFAVQLSPN